MKELIKYFNDNYGSKYGNIDYPRTNKQIYSTYQIIKEFGVDDEKLDKLLKEVELPNPKTIEERDMHSECKASITKDDVLDMLPCYDIEEIVLSYTKEELDKLERVFEYSNDSTPSLKIPKFDLDNTFCIVVLSHNGEIITKEESIMLCSHYDEDYEYYSPEHCEIYITTKRGLNPAETVALDDEYFKKYYSLLINDGRLGNSEGNERIEYSYDDIVSFTIYKKREKILDKKFVQYTRRLIPLSYNTADFESYISLNIKYPPLYEFFKTGGYLHILIQGFDAATVDVSIPIGENILFPITNMYNHDIIEGYRLDAISDICYCDTNGDLIVAKIIISGSYYLGDSTRLVCRFKDNNGNKLSCDDINVDFVGVYFEEGPFLPCKKLPEA